jgi:hypothetical protein
MVRIDHMSARGIDRFIFAQRSAMSLALGMLDRRSWCLVALARDDVDDLGPNQTGTADRVEGHARDPRLILEKCEKNMLSANHVLPVFSGDYLRALKGVPHTWCQRRKVFHSRLSIYFRQSA